MPERVAYSPKEFAELFGKSQTWGYRQIYAGKVKAIKDFGRTQIPAAEVERVLETAGIHTRKTDAIAKPEGLNREQESVWNRFVKMRSLQIEAESGSSVGASAAEASPWRRIASGWSGSSSPAKMDEGD